MVGKKGKKDFLIKALGVKIAIVVLIFILIIPFVPVETQIQCFTTPCDPIVENKSIISILLEN